MYFGNTTYNVRWQGTKPMALLHEGTSLRSQLTKNDRNQVLREQYLDVSCSNSSENSKSFTNATYPQRASSRVPWLNAFLHSRTRYADFIANEEASKSRKLVSQNSSLFPAWAAEADASKYAQMRRISSAQLLCQRERSVPLSVEWALDELLIADKWLHDKYLSAAGRKSATRELCGGASDRAGRSLPSRVLARGDDQRTEIRHSNVYEAPGLPEREAARVFQGVGICSRYRARTLPRNVRELVEDMDTKKSSSTCSLPETSHMGVISWYLAAE